jgi:hypothetical protein
MRRAIPFILFSALVAPALPAAARGLGEGTPARTLDLSLPKDAPTATRGSPAPGNAAALPDLGSTPGDDAGGPRGRAAKAATRTGLDGGRPDEAGYAPRSSAPSADLPYGAGYEARQGGVGQGQGAGRGR